MHELKVLMRALGFDVKKPDIIKLVHGKDFLPVLIIVSSILLKSSLITVSRNNVSLQLNL